MLSITISSVSYPTGHNPIEFGNKEKLVAREHDLVLSRLENVFQQLEVCQAVKTERNGNAGKRFKLSI